MASVIPVRVVAAGLGYLMLAAGIGVISAPPAVAMPSGQIGAWGAGRSGELGDGTATDSVAAVSVLSTGVLAGKTIVQVDAGDSHACAVTSDGLLACWGDNNFGELGIGPSGKQLTPQPVTGGALAGKAVVQVSAGSKHTCALTKDGVVACWGDGVGGALGNQPSVSSAIPVPVFTSGILAGRTITQVSAGLDFTCAVASGAVSCWGVNAYGQLGDGTTSTRAIPVNTTSSGASALAGKTVTQVSVGSYHACARSSDGSLACWGWNYNQAVTPSTAVTTVAVPVLADQGALAGRTVSQVSAGNAFTCAVASGSVVCWGANDYGQMANGPVSKSPQATPALATVAAPSALEGKTISLVSTGAFHACALSSEGAIACWGYGTAGPAIGVTVPFSVTGNPGSGVMAGAVARGVSAGYQFTVGLTSSLPDSPTGLGAKAGDAQATVTWAAPASTGGSPITSFVVQQSTDAGTTWTQAAGSPTATAAGSLLVKGLPNGVNVTFRVAATTVAGQGAFSGPTSVVRPDAAAVAPGAVQALAARNSRSRVVVLSWQPPATGAAPTSYQVRRKQRGHRYSAWATVTAQTVTIRRLRKGKRYSFAVRAGSPAGFGPGVVVTLTVR